MSTPNILTPPTGQIWTVAKNDLTWLQKHERVAIVALVLLVGGFLGNKALNYDASLKDAKVAALTQVVAQDKQNTAALALASATAQQQYQMTLDAVTKQNVALEASVAQMAANLGKQQAVDKQMPLPQLGQRLQALVPAATGVTATSTGLTLDSVSSVAVVQSLEQVPVLKDELTNETQVAANNAALLSDADKVIDADGKEITGLNKELTDQQADTKAIIAADKVKIKKAWRSGFKWGFGLGFATGAYVMHAL
jgi:hypothetical protein